MKMKIEQAIQQMQDIIACWEEFLRNPENNDLQGTGLELEAMRMAVQALKENPRWIPCSERLPEMHEEEFCDETFRTSDTVLFCTADRVHVGFCAYYGDKLVWEIQDGLACEDGVTAWMPMPLPY